MRTRCSTRTSPSARRAFRPSRAEYRPTWPSAEQFTPPAGVFLVVDDDDGEPVGCGGVRRIQRRPETFEVRFEVKHLWLAPSARGQGGGRLLLDELERRAIEFGAQELVLDTNASLEAAGGLYQSAGYATSSRTTTTRTRRTGTASACSARQIEYGSGSPVRSSGGRWREVVVRDEVHGRPRPLRDARSGRSWPG